MLLGLLVLDTRYTALLDLESNSSLLFFKKKKNIILLIVVFVSIYLSFPIIGNVCNQFSLSIDDICVQIWRYGPIITLEENIWDYEKDNWYESQT